MQEEYPRGETCHMTTGLSVRVISLCPVTSQRSSHDTHVCGVCKCGGGGGGDGVVVKFMTQCCCRSTELPCRAPGPAEALARESKWAPGLTWVSLPQR